MVKRDVFDEEFVFNVDRSASGSLLEKTDASGTIMSLASPLGLLPALLLSTFAPPWPSQAVQGQSISENTPAT